MNNSRFTFRKIATITWIFRILLGLLILCALWLYFTDSGQVFLARLIGTEGAPSMMPFHDSKAEQAAAEKLEALGVLVVRDPPDRRVTTVNFCEKQAPPEAFEQLAKLSRVKAILLGSSGITDDQLRHLSQLQHLSSLTLHGTPITDAGLRHLTALKSLEALHLVDTKITDAGLESITKIPKLSILDLSGTRVTDQGIAELASLQHLTYLLLSRTSVTDTALKELKKFPALTRIVLYQTRISEETIGVLKRAKSQWTINYDGEKTIPRE